MTETVAEAALRQEIRKLRRTLSERSAPLPDLGQCEAVGRFIRNGFDEGRCPRRARHERNGKVLCGMHTHHLDRRRTWQVRVLDASENDAGVTLSPEEVRQVAAILREAA